MRRHIIPELEESARDLNKLMKKNCPNLNWKEEEVKEEDSLTIKKMPCFESHKTNIN